MKPVVILFVVAFVLAVSAPVDARIWYVPSECPTIQAGIDSASTGDTVLVADGTYTGDGNRDIDFHGKAILVMSENGPDVAIIDCQGDSLDPHRGFYFHSGETDTSVVNGFTITNGLVDRGGAFYLDASSPTITNCTMTGNSATVDGYGGAIYTENSSPTISHCVISGNTAEGSVATGGGIHMFGGTPTITHCTITGNTAQGEATSGGGIAYYGFSASDTAKIINCTISGNAAVGSTWGSGGGIWFYNSFPTISGCTISNNDAEHGGGIYWSYANDQIADDGTPTISDCMITENHATRGAGLFCQRGTPVITACTVAANTAISTGGGVRCGAGCDALITNCKITGNTVAGGSDPEGGGIYCDWSDPQITNCTISSNTAGEGAGISAYESHPTVLNSILWADIPDEFYLLSATVTVRFSDVEGGWAGEGNIDEDPLFVDPDGPDDDPDTWEDNDYRLSSGSPCIDAGDNAAVPPGVTTDLEGNPRIVDGNGECPVTVDMGAYEFQLDTECLVSPTSLNFGIVTVGDYLDTTFNIVNTGEAALCGTVTVSCEHYSIVSEGAFCLATGESLTVTVRFEPDTSGEHHCTVETGNDLCCSDVSCTGVGEYPPSCQVWPVSLDFDSVFVGSYLDNTFTITNTGGGSLSGSVSESCDHYDIISGGGAYSLGTGQSRTATVRFAPTEPGTHNCTVETGSDLCDDVLCTGVGEEPPSCEVSPPSLDFGTVIVGSSLNETFTITNTGGGTLSGSVSESCDHYGIISGGGAYSLGPGQSRTVIVRFAPTEPGTHDCIIETGSDFCDDVFCTGLGEYAIEIQAYCYTCGDAVSVSITLDGSPTGYYTPHIFWGLTGTHTFTVPDTDPSGHTFERWNTGETSTTITVTSSGTYIARYGAILVPALTEWSLIVLVVLVLLSASVVLRRRKRAVSL